MHTGKWIALLLVVASGVRGAEKPIELGDKIPDFQKLPTADGKVSSLSDFSQDVLVVIVTCNECPVARSYEPRFVEFAQKYGGDKGKAGIVAINPYDRDGDRIEDMKVRAKESSFPFPYAQDKEQNFAKQLGAQKTPHVFVFDKDRKLVYKGAFDDSWIDASAVKRHYLVEVVESVLTGSKVLEPTKPEGCPIHFD